MDLEELRKICEEYDEENGSYPESECEGYSVYDFVRSKVTGEEQQYAVPDDWARKEKK